MLAGHHDIQELSKTYYQISRARTKVQHAIINHHVPLYFPEMHKYWTSTRNEWWVRFMIEFPTPARLRLAFWLAAVVAVRARENSFREKYDRYVSSNPKDPDLKRKALTAVAAKMARVAYGMIKKNQPYRRFFEQSLPSGSIPLNRAVGAPA